MPQRAAAASTPRRPPPHPRPLQPHLRSALILPRRRNPLLRSPRRGALLWTRRCFTHLGPPLRGSLRLPPSPMQSTPVASRLLPEQLTRDEGVVPSAGTAEKTSTLKRKNVEPEDIEANAIDAETMGTSSSKEKEVVKGQSLAQFLKHLRRLLLHMIVQQRTQEVNNVLHQRAQEAKSCEPSCATTCYFVEHHAIWNLAM